MPIMLREGKKVSRGHQLCQILKQRVGDTGVLVAKSLGPSEVSPQKRRNSHSLLAGNGRCSIGYSDVIYQRHVVCQTAVSENVSPLQEHVMRPLRYSINVTLDGCCDHRAMFADEELHRHAVENIEQADALLFGRVTYEMKEAAWRPQARTGARPDWMEPFARTIEAAKKYVVSSTLDRVDWNAELVRGDLGKAVQQLKRESGKGLFVGGVKLPQALAELGLIDEYEFVVHPRVAGHGPTLFAGLSKHLDLKLVSRLEFGSGAVAMRYEPRR
jgi:dihydrofolate reductase